MTRPQDRLTRRQLLARGAGAAGAALLLDALPAAAQTQPAASPAPPPVVLPSERMLKGVSLIGDVNPYDDALGVRPYLLSGARPTEVVTLWVVWPELQPHRPDPLTLAQSFAQLSDPAGPAAAKIAQLDAQIARANADGRRTGLTIYQGFPDWTHPSVGCLDPRLSRDVGGPGYPGAGRHNAGARIPDDRSEDGPWAWFVAWCCARWADTGGVKTPGPGRGGASTGNPQGARLDWLQPMNEPNLAWWPQTSPLFPDGTIASAVAEMMRSAAAVAARYRTGATPQGPELLMPNTADVVTAESSFGTPWRDFTRGLLAQLDGWQPPTPVGWSQHNYADVKYGVQREGPGAGLWRAEEAIALLRAGGWPEPALWLTEGGYQFGVRATEMENVYLVDPAKTADPRSADVFTEQVKLLRENWEAMERLPVRLWSQYLVNDKDLRFQSSLRGPVRGDANGVLTPFAPPYPAYDLWPELGA
ncbi:MAG TPA: hypothetical protein VLK58_20280 [Conexibacter sp.]|nr:hypothetical protein [Conexibacter sp.]